jgi:anti-sigma regulatory factor (Ser/Thr protein kinase)
MPDMTLPAGVMTPRAARAFVSAWLSSWGLDDLRDRAVLATSELVTNAVEHAGGDVGVRIEVDDDEVRIAVTDPDASVPVTRGVSETALGGRGLHIVDAMSDRWGTERLGGDGKTTWCALHVDRGGP